MTRWGTVRATLGGDTRILASDGGADAVVGRWYVLTATEGAKRAVRLEVGPEPWALSFT